MAPGAPFLWPVVETFLSRTLYELWIDRVSVLVFASLRLDGIRISDIMGCSRTYVLIIHPPAFLERDMKNRLCTAIDPEAESPPASGLTAVVASYYWREILVVEDSHLNPRAPVRLRSVDVPA